MTEYVPNPLCFEAIVSLTLPEADNVILTIHDITGRKIKTLHSGFLQKGVHSFALDAEGMEEGMYLLGMKTNGVLENKKILLLR